MNSFAIIEEIKTALTTAGISNVYDSLITPDKIASAASPYACIGEFRKADGRVMDETEQKCFIDVFIWTKYKGKKQCLTYSDALETALASLSRNYFLEEAYFDYDEESGWSLGVISLRTYLE